MPHKQSSVAKKATLMHATDCINRIKCLFSGTGVQKFWPWLILRQGDEVWLPATILRLRSCKHRLPRFPPSSAGRQLPGKNAQVCENLWRDSCDDTLRNLSKDGFTCTSISHPSSIPWILAKWKSKLSPWSPVRLIFFILYAEDQCWTL